MSPLAANGFLFIVTTDGTVTCLDGVKGKKLWEHAFPDSVRSSPSLVGSRVYLTDEQGATHIFEAAGSFKEVGTARLGEKVTTTPAFAPGRVFIRGAQHLFCLGGGK